MSTYKVLLSWTDDDGEHQPGDQVEISPNSPAEQVELDRLIDYGVIVADTVKHESAKRDRT